MTTVSYALGTPRAAVSRGGDCRAHDLTQGRDVLGEHRFATTTACQISNGMLRLTVGASGAAPSLTVEAWRGRTVINDFYTDVYSDTWEGEISTPAWFAVGTITIDSTSVSALLTAVHIKRLTPEALTLRLVSALLGNVFVTLKRGERMVHIQHGSTRTPVARTRRVRFSASPALSASAVPGRVEEAVPGIQGLSRFVAAIDPVTANAGTFSLTTASVTTARFGAGVGTLRTPQDRPLAYHQQLGNVSRPRLVVT